MINNILGICLIPSASPDQQITSSANYYEGKYMILYFLPLLCLFAFDVVVVVFRFQATNVDIRGAYQQREKFIE